MVWMTTFINLLLPSARVCLYIIPSKQFLRTNFSHLHQQFAHLEITQSEKDSPLKRFPAHTGWNQDSLESKITFFFYFSEAEVFSAVNMNSTKLYKIWESLWYLIIYGTGGEVNFLGSLYKKMQWFHASADALWGSLPLLWNSINRREAFTLMVEKQEIWKNADHCSGANTNGITLGIILRYLSHLLTA